MANPVIFGTHQFRTQKAATEEARQRINQYESGEKLALDDETFFRDLFKLHDQHDEKVGVGIKHIEVRRDFHNNRCLYILREDGSETDISWVHCIRPATKKATVAMAFRRAVKDIIVSYKKECLKRGCKCPILKKQLTFENSHAVYIKPSFDSLLSSFLSNNNLTYDSIELTNPGPKDEDQRGLIKDNNIKTSWVKYHERNANLELWSEEANLRKQKTD